MKLFSDYGLKLDFEGYKQLEAVNYSTLKKINELGAKALIKQNEDKKGTALRKGNLVEDLLLFPEIIDDKYYINTLTDIPTASSLILADKTAELLLEKGISTLDVDEISLEAEESIHRDIILTARNISNLWSKQSDETVLSKINKSFWKYVSLKMWETKLEIVTIEEWEKANQLVTILKSHRFTKDLFIHNSDIEVLKQFPYIYETKIKNKKVKLKILVDYMLVDHKNKLVYVFDLKTGSPNATQFLTNFYSFKYYLQGGIYFKGIETLIKKEFKDYTIHNNSFTFIYISTKELNPYPLNWVMSENSISKAWKGFDKNGYHTKGINELLSEYVFYKKYNPIEDKETIDNNGIMEIPLGI